MVRGRRDTEHDRDEPVLKIDADPIEALKALMETGTGEDDPRRKAERQRQAENKQARPNKP